MAARSEHLWASSAQVPLPGLASTLSVVKLVRDNLPLMQKALSEDIDLRFEFDQSPYVTNSMWNVGIEGLLLFAYLALAIQSAREHPN